MLFESLHKFELHCLHLQSDPPAALHADMAASQTSFEKPHPRCTAVIPLADAFTFLKFENYLKSKE